MMLDTKKLIIVSVVAIAVLGGVGYHLMQKMKYKNVDEQQILSKSNNEAFIAGKLIKINSSKGYNTLIKRAVNKGEDFLLRDILSEKEYQYLKTAYFKKIEDKLLEYENKINEAKEQAKYIFNQAHQLNNENKNMTQAEFKNWVKDLKMAQTIELQKTEEQKNYFISNRPYFKRYELVQLIDNYYKKNPNITTRNNTNVRSLTLSQILEDRSKGGNEFNTYLAFDEILLNIKVALKNKNKISLKDILPKYEAEIYFENLLNNPNYKTKNKSQKLTTLQMHGLNHKIYGEYIAHMYVTLDTESPQFKEIEKEVTKLFTSKNIELLKQKKQQKSL